MKDVLRRVSGPMDYPGNPHEGVPGLPDKRSGDEYVISGNVPVALAAASEETCGALYSGF